MARRRHLEGARLALSWDDSKSNQPIKQTDTYYGSHKFIKEEVKKGNQSDFKRVILQCAYSKKELTYLENKILFTLAVLENENYLNDNIEGRYFKKDFDFSSSLCTFRV